MLEPPPLSKSSDSPPERMPPLRPVQELRGASAVLLPYFTHLVAGTAVVAGSVVLSAIIYVILFIIAAVTGGDLGSPAALPAWSIIIFLESLASVIFIIAPIVYIAQKCCRNLRWPRLSQIPLCIFLCFAEVFLLSQLFVWWIGESSITAAKVGLVMSLILLIPLSVYWSLLQASDWLARLGLGIVARMRRAR